MNHGLTVEAVGTGYEVAVDFSSLTGEPLTNGVVEAAGTGYKVAVDFSSLTGEPRHTNLQCDYHPPPPHLLQVSPG